MSTYSVVIPVYNSTASLVELSDRLTAVFQSLNASYEIIFVNDASSNSNTNKILNQLSQTEKVTVIHLPYNNGKTRAVLAGLKETKGAHIVIMDDDLQHRPEDLPTLLQHKKHDVVIAAYPRNTETWWLQLGSQIKNLLDFWICNKPQHIRSGPFKVINKTTAMKIVDLPAKNPVFSALLYFATRDIVNVPIAQEKRKFGSSGFTFIKRLQLIKNLVCYNSRWALTYYSAKKKSPL